uniref:NFATC2-interacting protein n=1 Tax=Astyanax mexicanus TaxID=7994 RepID=W5K790_ASTMX
PNPPAKRRRVIDPSAITSVPIYSNKFQVNSSLQLKPAVFKQVDPTGDEEEARLWSPSPPKTKQQPTAITLSDSEDESEQPDTLQSPSPPPPTFSPGRRTRRADKKIEINRRLEVIDSLLCPSPEREDDDDPGYSDCSSSGNDLDDDDDIIIVSNEDKQKRRAPRSEPRGPAREISLKFRWRTDVHRIPLLSTAPLSQAVDQLSAKLKVPPSQILLLKQETELPTQSTVAELGLGIADIICVVVTEDKEEENSIRDLITVRLQGKEKGSAQEYSLHKDDPLGSILTQYTSGLSAAAKRKVKFLFDGSKVTPNQTPSQLDMENGDVIEVWN